MKESDYIWKGAEGTGILKNEHRRDVEQYYMDLNFSWRLGEDVINLKSLVETLEEINNYGDKKERS